MSQLTATKRDARDNLRNVRLAKNVPAVIYGNEKTPELVTLARFDLEKESARRGFYSRVLTLEIDGQKQDVLVKEVQRHPVYDYPVHADFMRVQKDQKIRVFVSIDYQNADKSSAVKKGGVVNYVHHKLEVRCSPYEIPQALVCDLSTLDTHRPATLVSLDMPANVTPVHPKRDNVLATIVAAATEEKSAEGVEEAKA